MAGKVVLVFSSTHHVLSAEEALEEQGIDFDVVPLPEGLSAGCGMALEIDADHHKTAIVLMEKAAIVCAGDYEV